MAQVKVLVAERIVEAHPLSENSTIGRSPASTVLIPDESVSREHAVIRRQMGTWFIEDLDSANGTRVNSREIESAVLEHNDTVTVGDSHFVFLEGVADAEPASGPVSTETSQDEVALGLEARATDSEATKTGVRFLGLSGAGA